MTSIQDTETMYQVAEKFASIVENDQMRAQFVGNPAGTLPEADLPKDLTVYADTADMVHLVVPAAVDMDRIAARDESYFEELGRAALGFCAYRDLPIPE
ncbi:hypothetical protein GCM10011316_15610 [Roseibium aquae]|uniref:Uncharacterized protein n=1 Tax=Roseibium aquae TaxID=1323746 RepID=A0A916TH16_9HYPH|nr:hypothetical protein [Roseibium aquae]GGB44467.1 hypothetical protein GCM10011316_15610 [Roseibium aquae]